MLKAFDRHLVLVLEQVVVEAVGGRESIARDRCEIFQHRLPVRLPRGERRGADVGPPIVPAAIAEIGRPQRILRELPFPLAIEQRVQRAAAVSVSAGVCACVDGASSTPGEDEAVFQLHDGRV